MSLTKAMALASSFDDYCDIRANGDKAKKELLLKDIWLKASYESERCAIRHRHSKKHHGNSPNTITAYNKHVAKFNTSTISIESSIRKIQDLLPNGMPSNSSPTRPISWGIDFAAKPITRDPSL